MNTTRLRSKRVVLPTIALVTALGAGGAVWATAASAGVSGGEKDRIGTAAVQAVGGGTVLDVETGDDPGEAYGVEIRRPDGSEVDVALDKNLTVIGQDADTPDGTPDAGDRVLSAAERASAEQAARGAVSGGTVTQVEAGDGSGVAYEVEVRATDGTEWDVDLNAAFAVLGKTADN